MKMSAEHYEYLKNAIAPMADKIRSHRKFIENEGKSKDIEKRLRWDLTYYAGLSQWICDNLYEYLNDDHIDTALRRIVSELES